MHTFDLHLLVKAPAHLTPDRRLAWALDATANALRHTSSAWDFTFHTIGSADHVSYACDRHVGEVHVWIRAANGATDILAAVGAWAGNAVTPTDGTPHDVGTLLWVSDPLMACPHHSAPLVEEVSS